VHNQDLTVPAERRLQKPVEHLALAFAADQELPAGQPN
jgi:hypothetical protein